MVGSRFFWVLPFGLVAGIACSTGDKPSSAAATSGSAGQGQAGSAGSPSAAGSNAAGSSMGGVAGTGGSSSTAGLPGIKLEDCTGLPDGAICDPAAGFAAASGAFCVDQQCHRLADFAVACFNTTPRCIDGESFGVFDYTVTLVDQATCPADATLCTINPLKGEQLPFVLIDCGKYMPLDCIASELRSSVDPTPGVHQGKVRCRDFSLDETYCLPPYSGAAGAGGSG